MLLLDFQQVFLLQFLQAQISRSFIVRHIVVPGLGKLEELGPLSILNSNQL